MSQCAKVGNLLHVDAGGLGVCLLLAGIFYLGAFKPIIDRQADRARRQGQLEDKRAQATQVTATLTSLRSQLIKVREAVDQSAVRLQSASQLNRRLAEITDLAGACGLQVHEIQPGSMVAGERYETVGINLAGTGSYQTCAVFLHQLTGAFPDTGVASFELAGAPQEPGKPATFRFALTWYAAPSTSAAVAP